MKNNNIMMAHFVGLEKVKSWRGHINYNTPFGYFEEHELSFNVSWDWLMLVVDKIESIVEEDGEGFKVIIGEGKYAIIKDNFTTMLEIEDFGGSKFQCVYNVCSEFIKKYNERIQNRNNL